MDDSKTPPEDSSPSLDSPSEGGSLFGRSAVVEFEESHQIEADLKLRDVHPATAATPSPRRPSSRYQILGEVGHGAMGEVMLAYDHDLKRRVAMKVMKPGDDHKAEMVRRFLEEGQATGQLEHPNIVPVYDVGRTDAGKPFYTMRYVQGTSLERVLRSLRKGDREFRAEFTVTRFLQILEQVAMAVHFAHEKGVVHRDLKPANIMLGEYAEVFVMDWGLARILTRDEPMTGKKKLIGTPAYMSPEQAAGHDVIPASDTFALGIILYKCLTLRAPFHGLTLEALLADIRRASPAPPRHFNSRLPAELDRITLCALARNPDDRFKTCREFRDALQSFLEGVAERRRRRDRAEGIAGDGARRAAAYIKLRDELSVVERELREAERTTPGWLSLEDKAELIRLRRVVEDKSSETDRVFNDAVEVLMKALGHDPALRGARTALAELYYRRFSDAEAEGDRKASEFFRRLVETYHDGKYELELRGDGSLELNSDPVGVEAWLYEYVETELALTLDRERYLGTTPLKLALPMGSYLALLRRDGYREVRYPVCIGRLSQWRGKVKLYSDGEIGAGFAYVPAGPFIQGGDRGTLTSLPRARPVVDGFFVATRPVTNAEYRDFLNHLVANGCQEEAKKRVPRRGAEGADYWKFGPEGFTIPEVDAEGDRHLLEWPVLAVSCHDAQAYCEWRSERDGRTYTLGTEAEWEKAARGVDGRIYPWGNRFDPALCNMKDSRARAGPVAVGTTVGDVSPYGVHDMAGNCEEWNGDAAGDGRGSRIARGGAWNSNSVQVRSAYRSSVEPHLTAGIRGFRLFTREPLPRKG